MSQRTGFNSRLLFSILGSAVVLATYLFLVLGQSPEVTQVDSRAALIAMAGYLLGAGLLAAGSIQRLTTAALTLIPVAIALNITVGQTVAALGLTIYLDSIGTVVVAALAGPAAGVVTGILTNVVWGLSFNPIALPFAVVQVAIGVLAGSAARVGAFRLLWLAPITGAVTGAVAAMISAPISAFVFGGATGGGTGALVGAFQAMGRTLLEAATIQGLISDPLDKAITFSIAAALLLALPARFRHRFPFARDHRVFAQPAPAGPERK